MGSKKQTTSKSPSKSGNPATRAAAVRAVPTAPPLAPTAASAWKSKKDTDATDLLLPSGNVARCRPLNPQDFLTSGNIPDPIIGMVEKGIRSKKGLKPQAEREIMRDPKMLKAAMGMMDQALVASVINPPVAMPPEDGVERSDDILYADQVDFEDKSFIFNWAMGGTSDIAQFRRESRASVARVSDGSDAPSEAE